MLFFFPQLQMWESESLFLCAYTLQQSHFLFCVLRACIYTCPESTDITAEIFFSLIIQWKHNKTCLRNTIFPGLLNAMVHTVRFAVDWFILVANNMKAILSAIWRQDCTWTQLKLAALNLTVIWNLDHSHFRAQSTAMPQLHLFNLFRFCFVGLLGCFLRCGRCSRPNCYALRTELRSWCNSMPFPDRKDTDTGLECFAPSCKGWAFSPTLRKNKLLFLHSPIVKEYDWVLDPQPA